MKKIVLATATILFASGVAFAGSDHFGADFVPGSGSYPSTVDMTSTHGIGTVEAKPAVAGQPAPGYGQGIWGR